MRAQTGYAVIFIPHPAAASLWGSEASAGRHRSSLPSSARQLASIVIMSH